MLFIYSFQARSPWKDAPNAFRRLSVWVSSPPGAHSAAATALELRLKLWIKSTSNLSTPPGESASLQAAHAQIVCYRSAGGKPNIVGHIIAWRLGCVCVGTVVTHIRKCGQGQRGFTGRRGECLLAFYCTFTFLYQSILIRRLGCAYRFIEMCIRFRKNWLIGF